VQYWIYDLEYNGKCFAEFNEIISLQETPDKNRITPKITKFDPKISSGLFTPSILDAPKK